MCKFLKFAKFELNQKIWKTNQGQQADFYSRPACAHQCSAHGFAVMRARWPKDTRPADMVTHDRYAGQGVTQACSKVALWQHCVGDEEELADGDHR
jgi:hypothetical protein